MSTILNVAILGATGVVGQKAIALLQGMSRFRITELVASESRVGMRYGDVCDWREPLLPLPPSVAAIKLISPDAITADFIVSCLPSDLAASIEPMLSQRGKMVFSNAAAFRMHPDVPLLVPEINSSHLNLLAHQQTSGKIITNPNCSTVGVTLALAPLMELGAIEHVSVVTMQSASGAGYPGVPSLDLIGNTIPHIEGEAEKITLETKKILGTLGVSAEFAVTAHVHRVPVLYGHTITLHITFAQNVNKDNICKERALERYMAWNKKYHDLFVIHDKNGRPQSIKDLQHDDMRVHIGHLRVGDMPNMLGVVVLSHNLVRGAAGAVIANMQSYLRFCGETI